MDFRPSARAVEYADRTREFLADVVYPAEPVYAQQRAELVAGGAPWQLPGVVADARTEARSRGLWNLFLPDGTDPATIAERLRNPS